MATSEASEDTTTHWSAKSGKGIRDGVVSELTAFFDVNPGHEQELRAAVQRFADTLRASSLEEVLKTGLRDSRHVIFDGGKRLLWVTTFESDWDPYIEDALVVVGIDHFIDWMQHTNAGDAIDKWMREAGGAEMFRSARGTYRTDPARERAGRMSSGGLKEIIKSVQMPGTAYFNAMSDLTHFQIRKAWRVNEAFQKVLDTPEGAEALENPTLKPLLDQAAD